MATTRRKGRGAPTLQKQVAELRALAHPLRLRIMELFAEAPRTTKQVAELLGQPPTRLYHHVNALQRAGLLHLRETRPNRGVVEKWYEAVARRISAEGTEQGQELGETGRALAGVALDQARTELMAAMRNPQGERPYVARLVAVGSAARIAAIRRRIRATIAELQDDPETKRGGRLRTAQTERWVLTIAFAPALVVEPGPRRRKPLV